MGRVREFAGFFSLVRYVPDEWRGEGVNLGVILLCPELHDVRWQLTSNHQRARRFFHSEHDLDLQRLKLMKADLVERLEAERGALLRRDQLDGFAKLFRNQLQLTDLRSCVVADPQEDLARLYGRLVEPAAEAITAERPVMSTQQLRIAFGERLRQRQIYDRLEHDVVLPARYKPHPYEFGHAYRNGKLQVVHEVSFGLIDPDQNCERAIVLATEIEDVRSNPAVTSGPTAFTLVGAFASDQRDVEAAIRRLLQDKQVELWTQGELDQLVGKIERELAHAP